MQLRGKKIGILMIVIVYCLTFLIQSNFLFFQTRAQEKNVPRVNIVAILVDDKIYNKIENKGLKRYASEYIQGKLADTKALVLPLNLNNIKAYDIYRMMENIYFDGLENVNSSLIGLVMIGDIPLPVVNQDGYVFPTVYPYVDFENQKYVWDAESQYFVPNGNPEGQAEIWHGLINYGDDIDAYSDFFEKIRKYTSNPDEFIGDSMWYEDFIAQKQAFLDDNFQYYRNKIMFGEDIGYQRYSPLMNNIFKGESSENSVNLISELSDVIDIDFEGLDSVGDLIAEESQGMHTTKMVQQEIQSSFLADYNDLFSKSILSILRENVLAGGRWIKTNYNSDNKAVQVADVDNSSAKIQMKDVLYLGNENIQGLIENLNSLMENMVDRKIEKENYGMDLVIPVEYKEVNGRKRWFKCRYTTNIYENFYFGRNARFVDSAKDLSIYRGTYRNLDSLDGVTYSSLLTGENPSVSSGDKTNVRLKSIGASYDIFSDQVEGNRGYNMSNIEEDLNVYNDNARRGQNLYDFVSGWWGGASSINIDTGSLSKSRYELNGYTATDSWRPIFSMGGFQSLRLGEDEGFSGKGWIHGTGEGPQWAATSFQSYIKYSSITKRKGSETEKANEHKSFDSVDFRHLSSGVLRWSTVKESEKVFSMSNGSRRGGLFSSCSSSQKYSYKVISSVVKHGSTTDEEINGIEKYRYGENGTLGAYYHSIKSAYDDIKSEISLAKNTLSNLVSSIGSLSSEIDVEDFGDKGIKSYLDNILGKIKGEKTQLIDSYSLVSGLYADNLIEVMQYIQYLEGGDEDGAASDVKVGFLQSWINDINSIERGISSDRLLVISYYNQVYSKLISQQELRKSKISNLKELSPENSELIDQISLEFDNIVKLESTDDDGETTLIELSEDAVSGVLMESEGFDEKFLEANNKFKGLVEVDKVGPEIESLAKSDRDFLRRLSNNSVDSKDFSQADWINQYVKWTNGPGYNSEGARKNHDLLAGAIEYEAGMNILTPDRPIDSPRYVTMQSIAGNDMKFIYPDLFKVEVFSKEGIDGNGYDVHQLLTVGEIKKNLVKYLVGKVDEYNQILQKECSQAKGMDDYYNKLHGLGFDGATPSKEFHNCDSSFTYAEFVKALGGEEMLDVIAEMLYYQNLTNTRKISSLSVHEDIEFIKNSFNLNDKREQVLQDYLIEGNEKVKNPLFIIPTYELSGYEVGFVNSNGRDYILPDEVDELQMEGLSLSDRYNSNSLSSKAGNETETPEEMQLNNECGIPSSGRLPLFSLNGSSVGSPWFDGFVCWMKTTLKKPANVKLTFDNSLGDILSSDSLGDFVKKSDLGQSLSDWGDSWSNFADDWEAMIDKNTKINTDKLITQMQVEADKHNKEAVLGESSASNILLNIDRNVKVSSSNNLLSESKPFSDLEIKSLVDIGNVMVEFIGTGDGCLKIDEKNLCDGNVVKTFNPKTDPFGGKVISADHIAGNSALQVRIGINGRYIEKIIKFTVSPGQLESVDIVFGDKFAVAGMLTPVEVIGYDKYKNHISWGMEKYKFTVSTGRFLKDGAYQESFETNDFRNLKFYYQPPLEAENGSRAIIQISKVKDPNTYLKTQSIDVVQAHPEIKLNGKDLEKNHYYRLKNDEGIYDGNKLNVSKLQKIDIVMKDLGGKVVDVDSQIIVSSQNGLVTLGQVKIGDNGEYNFFEMNKSYMSNGHATIYYYPTKVAGNDTISIEIPGLDIRYINLTIQPSQLSNVMIVPEREVLNQGDKMGVELFLTDARGNLIDETNALKLDFDDSKIEFVDYPGAKNSINVQVEKGYKKLDIKGIGAGLTYIIGGGVYAEIDIDKHLFPNSGLNIMYLNYFGSDWGNQWGYFSNNDHYIENLMKKSNKVITTTTQLISEDKIKKMVWKIQPGFKILNSDNISTSLTMFEGKIGMNIGGSASMVIPMPDFIISGTNTQDSIYDVLDNSSNKGKNYMFFIPRDLKYSLGKNGEILDNGLEVENIFSGNVSLQLTDYLMDNGDNVWNVVSRGINYGSLVIHYPNMQPSMSNFTLLGDRYFLGTTFSNGSTDNLLSIGVFDGASDFELESNYTSIQDSNDVDERVGFLGDFKNITLFAEGEIVGEATKKFGSEFVINLGDPVLSRKDLNENVYGTKFDGGIGDLIYVDTEKDIYSTYQIDFNNDGNEDLLVVYLDGTIKLAKNYGGSPDLRNMQELMRIAVGIKDVFVGDLDGNKYDDILVYTDNNQLRAYLNNGGIFDVDGSVVCLNQNVIEGEVSSSPSDLEGIFQLFIEDMNVDGVLDIITYDNMGYIKVFYGGSTKAGLNYLSTDQYSCDAGWYSRQEKNMTKVAELGVQISGDDVFDNSLLHWKGMSKPEMKIDESELSEYGVSFDPDSLTGMIMQKTAEGDGDISAVIEEVMSNMDISKASEKYLEDTVKFVDVSLYENKLEGGGDENNNYIFASSSFLNPNNPEDYGSVWKNYSVKGTGPKILQNGDIVTVRVTIKASDRFGFEGTYGDVIQGPWNLYFDDEGIFKGIVFKTDPGNAIIKKKDGKFAYLIDNIKLAPGEKMIFEYDLEYHGLPLRKMSIAYKTFWSNDDIPDIKLQSVDGCEKDFDVYINGGSNKRFSYKKIPLQEMINDEYLKEDDMTQDYGSDLMSMGSDISQLPGLVGDSISRRSLLGGGVLEVSDDEKGKKTLKNAILKKIEEGGLESLNIDLDIDLSLFEEQTDAIEEVIDDITKGMCNGFSFGGSSNCKGLPVPFNQALLAPGKYHLFGCWELPMGPLEGGLPSFFFPGTVYTPFGPIPIPWGLKSGSDGFLWPGGGTYPSFIRIYAAPTLTAQLGIAVCTSPDAVWRYIPSPISDIAGNCVVFAVKPQCKGGGDAAGSIDDRDNPNEVYTEIIEDVKDSGVCMQSQKGRMVTVEGKRSSPLNLHSDVNVGDGFDVDASFLGIIDLEIESFVGINETDKSSVSFMIGDVDVLGGKYSVNKIRGGIQQGVRKLLIDKWLDPQIRYILNQLTKMHINIILPDMSNLGKNEVQVMGNLINNFGDYVNGGEIEDDKTSNEGGKVSAWEKISRENVEEFNKQIANPFEALSSLMNESNIINISTETLTVKVPMIFPEDINAYEIYLHQWLDTNTQIVNEWRSVMETFVTNCDKKDTEQEKIMCREKANENLRAFIDFQNGDWQTMQNQIYANIVILQEYRNFPFEIYEWIHVINRYMSELMSLVNNTIGYLAYWTNTNSQRFVGYVDAIVLILNIIKTYQLLIDFSVEWGQNCGNCSRDTYDQYTCKLSLLCDMISLPIIQIPNFKLPNITIDLSNIDVSLDIILPKFNFQPVSINLPQLPNLPEPPSVSVNIKLFDLPNIPLLPEPPELPELPSFIPEVELDLPILPPAPEVPKLPNSIEGVIKIAKLIGKIFCIVKGQFGLVGESSVKAKIEQLTQRTYAVPWIDNIMDFTNWSVAPIHNYGVDYEIDSYVDLQFNFTSFYDYLDTLTKSINNLTTTSVSQLNGQIDSMISDSDLQGISDAVDGMGVEANFDLSMNDIGNINGDVEGIVSDDVEYVEYSKGKSRLKDVLALFREEVKNTSFSDNIGQSIDKIENQIDRENYIASNIEGLDKVRTEVIEYLDSEKVNYDGLLNMINEDYEGFLAMVESENDIRDGDVEDKLLTFNVNLFDVDSSTKDTIKSVVKDNPYEILLNNKQTIIDGYRKALNQNTAKDLGLTNTQYLVLRDNISSMKNQVNVLYTLTKPNSPTNLVAKNGGGETSKSLYAGLRLGSQMDAASVIDPSVVSKGIYERIQEGSNKGKFTKIIYSDSFVESMGDSYYDTSHVENHDKVLWNNNSIYKKCYNQDCFDYIGFEKKYYHSSTVNEIPNEERWIVFDSDTKLKISDREEEIKNWKVVGQNYDVLSFSWNNMDADGYLIKLVDRIDYSYEKSDYKPSNKLYKPKYVLVLPDTVDIDEIYNENIQIELFDNKIYTIQSLSGNEIVEILHYNPDKSRINIGITEIDRKWYYSRVASLNLDGNVYSIASPWSNQVVAGRQIVGDDLPPMGDATLIRNFNKEIVSEGDNLDGYVGTRYTLRVNWEDNVALSHLSVYKDGNLLSEKVTSKTEDFVDVDISIRTIPGKETYTSVGIDQFGNETEKVITVEYFVPDITITDILKNADGKTLSIVAELSQDIDQGSVSFQRQRGNSWNTMKPMGSGDESFRLVPKQKVVTGSAFSFGNEIAMYDKNGEAIALLDPDTAEIKMQNGYSDLFGVRVVVGDGMVIEVFNKETQNAVFSISVPAEKCLKIEADNYTVVDIPEKGNMGMYNGGKVVYRGGMNELFISPTGHLYSEYGMEGTYSYDRGMEAIQLVLYPNADVNKINPVKVWLKAKPLVSD